MSKSRLPSKDVSEVFTPESWNDDRKKWFEIPPLLASFHRSVPVLEFLDWRIEDIQRGSAETRLPLNVSSSNQYVTHQAALMLLSADYTGGIAFSTLFCGSPVIGFHAQRDDYGAYLWGASARVRWLRPSTEDLICRASIPERDWDAIARSFERGEDVTYKVRLKMYNDNSLVAYSDFHYWARNSHSLRDTGASLDKTHHMLTHKVRTSARLIAGLRSLIKLEDSPNELLDPYAGPAAGKQGLAMATRFSKDTPQLADLVRHRTMDCDRCLREFAAKQTQFAVINIGCGYDSRPWRMADLGDAIFLELDLPVMLQERTTAMPEPDASPYRIERSCFDLFQDTLVELLGEHPTILALPKFVIWEGGTMYFHEDVFLSVLADIRQIMGPDSQLWFDFVTSSAVNDQTGFPEVQSFMDGMRIVGNPFVNGFVDVRELLQRNGMVVERIALSSDLHESADRVHEHYGFVLSSFPSS